MIIRAENLSKQYIVHKRKPGIRGIARSILKPEKTVVDAVKSIDFSINEGEVVGFIGPNGAGKSTTIKMITGILMPTGGTIATMSLEPVKKRNVLAKNIGVVMGQRTQLWWNLPVIESYELLKEIYKIPSPIYESNLKYLNDILEIRDLYRTPLRQLSLGQRMRIELAASLLHSPTLVLLDEPTIGLDVVVKDRLREMIKDMNCRNNTTFLLTTHDMMDVDKLCSRIICIDKGQIIYDGSMEALRREYSPLSTIIFKCDHNIEIDFHKSVFMEKDGSVYKLKINKKKVSQSEIVSRIFREYDDISDFRIIDPTIEEIFKSFYTKNK
jgi:ABC-2 type transport system ATP-binding protein